MTSEHVIKTVKIIDWSTVREHTVFTISENSKQGEILLDVRGLGTRKAENQKGRKPKRPQT